MSASERAVYCTLLTSDRYLPGAVVLAHSLRDNGTRARIVALFTPETLKESTICELQSVFDEIIPVHILSNATPANLLLMNRLDLVSTFTKIELWRQTQYSKIVYMDADVVALRAPDELLSLQEDFAAAPDIGWPDIFNSGVMVLRPNLQDYYALRALAERGTSFDGGDQGLLNTYFKRWHRLSFTYNCTPSGNYQYMPAYRHFESTISLIHFIGQQKPWTQSRHAFASGTPYYQLLGRWWAQYDRHYRSLPGYLPPAQAFPGYSQQRIAAGTSSHDYSSFNATSPMRTSTTVHNVTAGSYAEKHHGISTTHEVPASQIAEDLHVLRRSPVSEGFIDTTPAFAPTLAHPQPIHHSSVTQSLRGHEHQAPTVEAPAEVRSVVPLYVHGEEQSAVYVTVPDSGLEKFTDLKAQFTAQTPTQTYRQAPPQAPPQADKAKPVATAAPLPPASPPQQPEERPFSPPRAEWDASREPPPRYSRPEASTLATQTYTMSEDTHLFRPPSSYPAAPKNMYYEVPTTKPEPQKLAPIFPWEAHASKPTRVFAEESPEPQNLPLDQDVMNDTVPEEPILEVDTPQQHIETLERLSRGTAFGTEYGNPDFTPAESWEKFSRGNAWDEVPEINKYIDAIQQRSKKNTLGRGGKSGVSSRPPPLKITDFPTEVDRPSLPVTPAPMRRSFWGSQDRPQESSEFPAAEGVPNQDDWNPLDRLEELRQRQLALFTQTIGSPGPTELSEGNEHLTGAET